MTSTNEPMQHHDAAEQLLGAVLTGVRDLDDLLATVAPDDFYQPQHTDIWDAVGRVHRAGNRPEPTAVRLALVDADSRINPVYLIDLAMGCTIPGNAAYHADLVVQAAGMRRLQEAGAKVREIGSTHGQLAERQEQARQAVDDACRGRVVSKARRIADILDDTIDAAQHGAGAVLSTPWPDIDRNIGGIAPGRLIVVAARPGGGKSIAGTNLALHVAKHHGHAALIASLEMPQREVMQRLLAHHARVSLSGLINATVPDSDWDLIAKRDAELRDLPVFVDDSSDLSVQGLRRLARDVQRQRDDLALIVVDYLQLMRPAQRQRESTRAEEVSQIARDLKLLARETGACVVAMAQVNREGGKADAGPRLTDLREGGIENDADVVVLLHRPDLEVPEVTATVAKNRHGAVGVSTLQLVGHYAQLANTSWSPTKGL